VPGVNASWHADFIREYADVDVCVAVQTPIGLLTPIVKGADGLRMLNLSNEVKALAKKVCGCGCGCGCGWVGRWVGG